jgi:hypothetical protein
MEIRRYLSYTASALSIVYGYQIAVPLLMGNIAAAIFEKIQAYRAEDLYSKNLHSKKAALYGLWAGVNLLRCVPIIGGIAAIILQMMGWLPIQVSVEARQTCVPFPDKPENRALALQLENALLTQGISLAKFKQIFVMFDDQKYIDEDRAPKIGKSYEAGFNVDLLDKNLGIKERLCIYIPTAKEIGLCTINQGTFMAYVSLACGSAEDYQHLQRKTLNLTDDLKRTLKEIAS